MELETEPPSSAPLRTSEQTEEPPPGQIEELQMWKAKAQVFEKMEANLLQKLEKVEQHSVSLLQLLDLACKLHKAAQRHDDSDRSTWELIKELQQQVEDTSWLQLKLKDIACEKQTLGREAEARGYLVRDAELVELYDDDDVDDDDDDDDDDEEFDDAFLDSDQIREEIDKLWHMTQELNFKHAEDLEELDKRNNELKWELEQIQLRSHRLSKLREK